MGRSRYSRAARGRVLPVVLLALGAAVPAQAQLAEAPGAGAARAVPPPVSDTARPGELRPTPPPLETPFALSQLRYERVQDARVQSRFAIKRLFSERGLRYPATEMFLRIFKRERVLEVWVRAPEQERYALLKSYDICALAGELGPKRRQGDMQVPEGFYYVDHFNPTSDYLLSLHVDYPNRSDAILGDTAALGGDIFIHGGCNSEGCIAITNEGIRELYWLSVETKGAGQARIPVHIFPARLNDTDLPILTNAFSARPALTSFWRSLKPGFDYFEQNGRVPLMSVSERGEYRIAGEDRGEPAAPQPTGPVPLGTPVNGSERTPLGTPVEGGPVPLGAPVGPPAGSKAGESAAPAASPQQKPAPNPAAKPAGPVPLGKPVGGG